jgi:hypothetical protein
MRHCSKIPAILKSMGRAAQIFLRKPLFHFTGLTSLNRQQGDSVTFVGSVLSVGKAMPPIMPSTG